MQDESIRDAARAVEVEDHALLQLLLEEGHVVWSITELSSALNPRGTSVAAVDAVTRLEADGLVHRVGDFVFASRAASRAWRLQL
jgi:hypothetical protein